MNTRQSILKTVTVLWLIVTVGTASFAAAAPTSQPASQPQGGAISVVTLNMMSAGLAPPGRIAGAINRHHPDVVFLQEVTDAQAGQISRALNLHQAATAKLVSKLVPRDAELDTAILCRQPLTGIRLLATSRPGAEPSLFGMIATTRLADQPISLVCVHLRSTHPGTLQMMKAQTEQRLAQMRVLVDELSKIDGAIILGGDFNQGFTAWSFAPLAPRFSHAFDQAGHGPAFTFPGFAGGIQIDHIFYTSPMEAADCFVDPAEVSDHRLVVGKLRVK